MRTSTISDSQQPAGASSRLTLGIGLLVMLALVAVVAVTAFCTVCTDLYSYDDVGFLLLTQKTLAAGHALYDQTVTSYGPAYYAWEQLLRTVTSLPLAHDTTLLFTTCSIVVSALLGAACVARLGRDLFFTAGTFLAVATLLMVMKAEAGHPQELCVLMLTGAMVAVAYLGSGKRATVILGLVGFAVGVVGMTKPNLGVFAAVAAAITFLRLAPAGKPANLLFGVSGLAALVLPFALMRHNLPEVTGYCLVTSAAILLLLLQLLKWNPEQRLAWSTFGAAIAGLAVAVVVSAGYALATGTSVKGLVHGLFLQHLAFDQRFSFYSPFAQRDLALPLVVAAAVWVAGGPARSLWKDYPWVPDLLKCAVAPFMIFAVLQFGITVAFIWSLPLVAATAGPASRQGRDAWTFAPRYFALSLAVLNALWGYPIWGSQAGLSFFLLIPVAMVSCADGLRYGNWGFDTRATAWKVSSLAAALVVLGLAWLQADGALAAYRRLEPSGLPGSRWLHLPREQSDFYRQVIQAARTHGRNFFTMPTLGSLYLWAHADPPSAINLTSWMTLLTPEQQTKVVEDLERTPDLCVVRWNPQVEFWTRGRDISDNKVVRYVEDNFKVVDSFNGCDILVRKSAGDLSGPASR